MPLTGDTNLTSDQTEPVSPDVVGTPFPGRPGYLTGRCGHAVAGSEWRAGFRVCERCPDETIHDGDNCDCHGTSEGGPTPGMEVLTITPSPYVRGVFRNLGA